MLTADFASLKGKRGLILGIANSHSIAYGCARACRSLGAELAVTYLNDKAKPYVEPLAQELEAKHLLPCNVSEEGALEAVFDTLANDWGQLDFLIHAIAFAPKDDLQGRLVDSSSHGFGVAMDVSCHSFLRCARLAEPLMRQGGALFAMSFLGSQRVVDHYNLMGPVKAALESSVRYLASELGDQGIRVHAISPGPIPTRAASGLKDFQELLDEERERAPLHKAVDIDHVGMLVAMLAGEAGALLTGETLYVDAGYHIMG